jgi:CubicO group peptidase (beta-lactamase class C family)
VEREKALLQPEPPGGFLFCAVEPEDAEAFAERFGGEGLPTTVAAGGDPDERRMDWKKPVREYIPEYRLHDAIASDRVTVRDLLCHHSGLPRHDWIWLPGDLLPAQMLAAMRYLEPSDDIRSTFQYSNLGYLVASMVAERVSGQSWAEFTRALTDKLHMKVTFTVEELAAAAHAAVPYDEGGHPPAFEALAC